MDFTATLSGITAPSFKPSSLPKLERRAGHTNKIKNVVLPSSSHEAITKASQILNITTNTFVEQACLYFLENLEKSPQLSYSEQLILSIILDEWKTKADERLQTQKTQPRKYQKKIQS